MVDLIGALTRRDGAVGLEAWRDFWDRLEARAVPAPEAAAILASLSTRLPDAAELAAFLASLAERRVDGEAVAPRPGVVNIVGTGGGPATFNISTAAALVAAAAGTPVVKTGSRAYASRCGSIDLLDRLGVRTTLSDAHLAEDLERFGLAFAGAHVYPPQLVLLARAILPLGIKQVGRCLNLLGPFLAQAPAAVQLTGISDHGLLPSFQALGGSLPGRRYWFCVNDLGADELLSVAPNRLIRAGEQAVEVLDPQALGLAPGSLADLAPASEDGSIVPHLLEILSGRGSAQATDTLCLNAAALALASGGGDDWTGELAKAREALVSGAARALLEAMRCRDEGARRAG